jgi:Cu(I)/Ag(I) efflux system membrane protein CusA/SilA
MVVPVLGGILVADEVIDLLLPVLFFAVRRRRWRRLHRRQGTDGVASGEPAGIRPADSVAPSYSPVA